MMCLGRAAGFRIDLAVRDPDRPGRFLLAVECDGARYHSTVWARERDRLRQTVLEGKAGVFTVSGALTGFTILNGKVSVFWKPAEMLRTVPMTWTCPLMPPVRMRI